MTEAKHSPIAATQTDIHSAREFRVAEALYEKLYPLDGICDAAELSVSPDARFAIFTATTRDADRTKLRTTISKVSLDAGSLVRVSSSVGNHRLAKFSPDGGRLAFLCDAAGEGEYHLHLQDVSTGQEKSFPVADGWVEDFHWSPDGARIALLVAGKLADVSGAAGGWTSSIAQSPKDSWLPAIESADDQGRQRSIWIFERESHALARLDIAGANIWEVNWCGRNQLGIIFTEDVDEGAWYNSELGLYDIRTESLMSLYTPAAQIAQPTASPDGRLLAFIEAICSDRNVVAGRLLLLDIANLAIRCVDTGGVDIAHVEWRSEATILVAGHRGLESVVGVIDAKTGSFSETFSSRTVTSGGSYLSVSGIGEDGDCVLLAESFFERPEVARIVDGNYISVKGFASSAAATFGQFEACERKWTARDDLPVEGWLLRPAAAIAAPLVMVVHGGPVWQWRPTWLGRHLGHALLLLELGYSLFLPNPRGSSGYGDIFVGKVLGDMGGADMNDLVDGVTSLVEDGCADWNRVGVMGKSYGGYMAARLVTQEDRIAAAVTISPFTNLITQRLLSNIPEFAEIFMMAEHSEGRQAYLERSPVMDTAGAKAPTLNICGALDRCTPPEEAAQFHRSLLLSGCSSALLTYPEEGHGIRGFPAMIDVAARIAAWFGTYLPTIEDRSAVR